MTRSKTPILDKISMGLDRLNALFQPAARWFEKNDMHMTGRMAAAAGGLLLIQAVLISFPIGFVFGSIYGAAAGVAFAVGMPPLGTVVSLALFGLQETSDNFFDKRKTKTVTNLAGQTVTGTAYDINRLQRYETQINRLSKSIGNPLIDGQEALRDKLNEAFAKAAPHVARVTIVNDPQATDGTPATYAFARQDVATTTTTTRLSA